MDRARALVLDDLAVAQPDHALGLRGDVGLVGDQDHRASFEVQTGENPKHVLGGVRVEVARRLVRQNQRRIGHDRARHRDALLLAPGELGGKVVHTAGHAHRLQRERGPPPALAAIQAGVGERQLDIGDRGRARHEVEALEDEADLAVAQVREVVLVELAGVHAVDQVAPGGGYVQAAEDVHECALATARAAHDRDEVAALDAQRDAAQRMHADRADAVGLADRAHVDHGGARAPAAGARTLRLQLAGGVLGECGAPDQRLAACAAHAGGRA